MTREELVNMRAYKVAQASTEYWYKNKNDKDVSIMTAFEDGVEWADNNPDNPWKNAKNEFPFVAKYAVCSKPVFVCIKDGHFEVAIYNKVYKEFQDTSLRRIEDVTYWMNIPEIE